VRARQITGEDPRRQAEFGGVGPRDHLVLVVEIEDRHDRAEDFFRAMVMASATSAKTVGAT
jgi:hypothetical protein